LIIKKIIKQFVNALLITYVYDHQGFVYVKKAILLQIN